MANKCEPASQRWKKGFFLFFRCFVAAKTVFILLTRDFIAMKTVAIAYDDRLHSNDNRLRRDEVRTSW